MPFTQEARRSCWESIRQYGPSYRSP
uniref:Uncharacterized protein n=1 Tax=Arundo donax TaxID=35708 RepID=A0A0A9H7S6_ARUDO